RTSPDVVLFDNHQTVSKRSIAEQSKLSSKDPAASVLPNKTGDSGPTVLPTQAAMARLVQRIEPEYPNAARQQHIQGTVLIDVIVDATGTVEAMSMVSGESQLMAAAEEAVRQWKFQPLMKDGKAEKFESRIAIDFTLAFEGSSGSQ
ncbi:MAG: energy transducer TonB, partial [Terriglobales bacterium]